MSRLAQPQCVYMYIYIYIHIYATLKASGKGGCYRKRCRTLEGSEELLAAEIRAVSNIYLHNLYTLAYILTGILPFSDSCI